MGDKTQLLALLLAARYRRPVPVVLGILAATLANHALAGLAGVWVTKLVGAGLMRWILAGSFFAMAAWMLVPDKLDAGAPQRRRLGAFAATLIAFFLVEMGDKTQIATVALAARYESLVAVVAGTAFGMMLANVPAVYFGERLLRRIPLKIMHALGAALFAALGALALVHF